MASWSAQLAVKKDQKVIKPFSGIMVTLLVALARRRRTAMARCERGLSPTAIHLTSVHHGLCVGCAGNPRYSVDSGPRRQNPGGGER
jgi:hypothetical protein